MPSLIDPAPRLPVIRQEDMTDEVHRFIDRWTSGGFKQSASNPVTLTFAHHPKSADPFSQLAIHLLTKTTLPVKLRQLAILRTAWLCKATYMWSSHLDVSLRAGLDPAIFQAVQHGPGDPTFSAFESAVVGSTDELLSDHRIGDRNWQTLMTEWGYPQVLDLLFTVGVFTTSAGIIRTAGMQRSPELIALAEQYGAPS
jgi:4-carboxymuconolactone decarboxylase